MRERQETSSPRSLWQTRDCVAATIAAVPVPSTISDIAVERLIVASHSGRDSAAS